MSNEALLLFLTAIAITIACTLEYAHHHGEELERGLDVPERVELD